VTRPGLEESTRRRVAGLVLTPGGVVTVFMMPLVGRLTGKVQPRYLIAVGAAICAALL
jgi:MFS transporter, DHA2 family, multidrug resistance protein